jgi:uncharacterized protein (TIGR03083 family)
VDELVAGIEQTIGAIRDLLQPLEPEGWLRETPCEEWRVRHLLSHISSGAAGFAGMDQPSVPEGWTTSQTGLNAITSMSVAARDPWTPEQIFDEYTRATDVLLERVRSLTPEEWDSESAGPPGVRNLRQLGFVLLMDSYIHLLDFRTALGRPLSLGAEPVALDLSIARIIELTPYGAVKRASLPEGFRCGFDLSGAHEIKADLVVEGGRGRFVDADTATVDRVEGTTTSYFFVAAGRPQWADEGGGITSTGPQAQRLLDEFVIWAR